MATIARDCWQGTRIAIRLVRIPSYFSAITLRTVELTTWVTEVQIEELARFDEHWRVILADDNAMLVRSLAKRGYLDVLKRRVPLFRVSDLGREVLRLTS